MTAAEFGYAYDMIGNSFIHADPRSSVVTNHYTSNQLNQYTNITVEPLLPADSFSFSSTVFFSTHCDYAPCDNTVVKTGVLTDSTAYYNVATGLYYYGHVNHDINRFVDAGFP